MQKKSNDKPIYYLAHPLVTWPTNDVRGFHYLHWMMKEKKRTTTATTDSNKNIHGSCRYVTILAVYDLAFRENTRENKRIFCMININKTLKQYTLSFKTLERSLKNINKHPETWAKRHATSRYLKLFNCVQFIQDLIICYSSESVWKENFSFITWC